MSKHNQAHLDYAQHTLTMERVAEGDHPNITEVEVELLERSGFGGVIRGGPTAPVGHPVRRGTYTDGFRFDLLSVVFEAKVFDGDNLSRVEILKALWPQRTALESVWRLQGRNGLVAACSELLVSWAMQRDQPTTVDPHAV